MFAVAPRKRRTRTVPKRWIIKAARQSLGPPPSSHLGGLNSRPLPRPFSVCRRDDGWNPHRSMTVPLFSLSSGPRQDRLLQSGRSGYIREPRENPNCRGQSVNEGPARTALAQMGVNGGVFRLRQVFIQVPRRPLANFPTVQLATAEYSLDRTQHFCSSQLILKSTCNAGNGVEPRSRLSH